MHIANKYFITRDINTKNPHSVKGMYEIIAKDIVLVSASRDTVDFF